MNDSLKKHKTASLLLFAIIISTFLSSCILPPRGRGGPVGHKHGQLKLNSTIQQFNNSTDSNSYYSRFYSLFFVNVFLGKWQGLII